MHVPSHVPKKPVPNTQTTNEKGTKSWHPITMKEQQPFNTRHNENFRMPYPKEHQDSIYHHKITRQNDR